MTQQITLRKKRPSPDADAQRLLLHALDVIDRHLHVLTAQDNIAKHLLPNMRISIDTLRTTFAVTREMLDDGINIDLTAVVTNMSVMALITSYTLFGMSLSYDAMDEEEGYVRQKFVETARHVFDTAHVVSGVCINVEPFPLVKYSPRAVV